MASTPESAPVPDAVTVFVSGSGSPATGVRETVAV